MVVTQKRIHACPEPLPCFRIVTVRLPLLPFTKSPANFASADAGSRNKKTPLGRISRNTSLKSSATRATLNQ